MALKKSAPSDNSSNLLRLHPDQRVRWLPGSLGDVYAHGAPWVRLSPNQTGRPRKSSTRSVRGSNGGTPR